MVILLYYVENCHALPGSDLIPKIIRVAKYKHGCSKCLHIRCVSEVRFCKNDSPYASAFWALRECSEFHKAQINCQLLSKTFVFFTVLTSAARSE